LKISYISNPTHQAGSIEIKNRFEIHIVHV
jgi:hypothetical protein